MSPREFDRLTFGDVNLLLEQMERERQQVREMMAERHGAR